MSKIVNCECGEVIRAESDERSSTRSTAVREAHPKMAKKMSREDMLAMAEDT